MPQSAGGAQTNVDSHLQELFQKARELNGQLKSDVEALASTHRLLTHYRRRAAKREGELLHDITNEKTDDGAPKFPKDLRAAELAIRIMTDAIRAEMEGEIAELTNTREAQAATLETNRNEIKIVLLEIRTHLRDAGEQHYLPLE